MSKHRKPAAAGGKRDLGERALVDWIRKRTRLDARRFPVGPGDDAAVAALSRRRLIVTVDTIAEGVDFLLGEASARRIGRKAMAVNLSDVAAMGGRPLFAVASVVLTRGLGARFSKDLYDGMRSVGDAFGCVVVGGDITAWDGGVVLTLTVGGEPAGRRAITRGGARPGNAVLVTGALGGSILGRHLDFTPRIEEGAWLAANFPPTAMIDISDGLGVDAAHVAAESGCLLVIDEKAIPVSRDAERLARRDGESPLSHAIGDGEDFELLFTLSAVKARRCVEAWPFETKLTVLGAVEVGEGAILRRADGTSREIGSEGYQHRG